jgi:hypothetical protein
MLIKTRNIQGDYHQKPIILKCGKLFLNRKVMNKKKPNKLRRLITGEIRKTMVKQGFFDGRFVGRAIPNKKKESSRRACRKKIMNQ